MGYRIVRNIWLSWESYDCYEHNLKDQVLDVEDSNTGDINIKTISTDITTHGPRSAGILVEHTGDGLVGIHIEDGSVLANGMNAHAIQVGHVNTGGEPERVVGFDEDGYRKQTVRVNGQVRGGTGQGGGHLSRGRRQSLHRA